MSATIEEIRHSAAHLVASAVCSLFEDVKIDIGPATDDGFYYDFDLPHRLSAEDFPAIEKAVRKLIGAKLPFVREELTRDQAKELFKDQPYKLERLADIPEGEPISIYRTGDYVDLCRGPHVEHSGCIGAVKLMSVAGSYYRGDEHNKMLQRVYGIAAASQKELDAIVKRLEEAKRRDHRKLGKELELFTITESVGPGLAHWLPKGARIRVAIEDYWRKEHFRHGYEMLFTPHIGRSNLWETSGHLGFYKDSMFPAMSVTEGDGDKTSQEAYYVKPMNCPFHIQAYLFKKYSYRDLPLRWAELGTVYRYEKDGVRHGLFRVRGFTQDDAHIFCAPEKIEDEIRFTVRFCLKILRRFGFTDISAYLSTKPEKAVGDPAKWEQATNSLRHALESEGLAYEVDEGGGAFYGPKIDMKIKDALGREWQLGTIQFDFNLILIEHYAGAFPTWLAPVQAAVLNITDAQLPFAQEVLAKLQAADIRAEGNWDNDKIGAKIRKATLAKTPYMLVIGGREAEAGLVAVRSREKGDLGTMTPEAFIELLRAEIAEEP